MRLWCDNARGKCQENTREACKTRFWSILLTFSNIFKRPAKEVNFLSKNKQTFDINNFKKALKRADTKSNFQLFCCIWHNIFSKKVKQSDLFGDLLCFCLLKLRNIFRVSPMICQIVFVPITIKKVLS